MPRREIKTMLLAAGLCATLTALAAALTDDQAEPQPDAKRVRPAPPTEQVLAEPTQPLDDRVSAEKITVYDPPPLPEQVVLPMPPVHRIAQDRAEVPISAEHWEKARTAIDRGLSFLRQSQTESGGWMTDVMQSPTHQPDKPSPVGVAVTAMIVKAIVQAEPAERDAEWAQNALRYMMSGRNENGSFEGGALTNYVTSAVVSALSSVGDADGEYSWEIRQGVQWLTSNQWDQSEGLGPRQDWFGGAGYGNRGRPDMSNTQMMLDALYDSGMSPDEPAFQRALAFASRAQNLKQTNPAPWAQSETAPNDGGFIYTPANGGESMASQAAGEGRYGEKIPAGRPRSLRSYGSMTYAGFKSMLYAGLSPDDVRVRAAFDWLRNHYTFDENPGLGQQGLYYYYHAMARALLVAQQEIVEDVDGEKHNWREDLIDALVERQREDGSWVNDADRWLEGDPRLVTAYAVLALEEALKPVLIAP